MISEGSEVSVYFVIQFFATFSSTVEGAGDGGVTFLDFLVDVHDRAVDLDPVLGSAVQGWDVFDVLHYFGVVDGEFGEFAGWDSVTV